MDLRRIAPSSRVSEYGEKSVEEKPIPSEGLSIWLDASNAASYPGSGTAWTDLSGNENNFSWNTNPSFTTGSAPYFNTNGYFATGPASNSVGINNTSGYTVMALAYVNYNVQTGAFKFFSSNASSGSGTRGIFSHLPWNNANVYFDQGGCCGPDTRTVAASGGSQAWVLWTFRGQANNSTRNIIKNNTILATNANAAANINLNSTGIRINNTVEYGSTWNAKLGAFIAYNRNLTDNEVSEIYNYYKPLYGLA